MLSKMDNCVERVDNKLVLYHVCKCLWLYAVSDCFGFSCSVMDATTASGRSPGSVASIIVEHVCKGQSGEVTVASKLHAAAMYLRVLSPTLYFLIMKRRAQKQRLKAD